MRSISCFTGLIVLIVAGSSFAQAPLPPAVIRAVKWVEKSPTPERRVGLAEMMRAQGLEQAALEELERAAKSLAANDPRAVELHETICWRMLPVATAQREAFRQNVARLKSIDPRNAWVPVWELYLLAGEPNRAELQSAAARPVTVAPVRFPSAFAEGAHLDLLRELDHSPVQAGVEVVAARNYEPLHALRDLDRALTREAEFVRESGRDADAKQILATRDHYRQAYIKASRHLVEKLFALHLAGRPDDRDALLASAKALPYLHDRKHLAGLLHRLESKQAWQLLIEPFLSSELTLIENPPDLATLQARSVVELQIKARKKTVQGKTVVYDGDVRFRLHEREVACDRLTLLHSDDPAAVVLTGEGKATLLGFSDYPGGIRADRFTYHADTGSFTLGGEVRLHGHDKTLKLRSCTLTQQGELRDRRSWLDDFRNALTLEARLDLLPTIAKVYDDAELPDEVRYLLALNTLRAHLSWHAPYLPPLPAPRERRELQDRIKVVQRIVGNDDSPWQEALGGEDWMLGDILPVQQSEFQEAVRIWRQKFNAARGDAPAAVVNIQAPEKDKFLWRIRNPRHPEVVRAERLLRSINSNDLRDKAQRWAAEIRRNNTVLTFDIAGAAPAGKAHSVLMDVRNAESVSFKLYRVEQPEELQFAAQNIGADFLYREHGLDDGGLFKRIERIYDLRARAKRGTDRYSRAHLADVAWKQEQLVHQWDVRVGDLAHHSSRHERRSWRRWDDDRWYDESDAHYFDDECSEHRPRIDKTYRPDDERHAISSWQCDRVVRIPENLLNKAGAYVLVAEANGQSAHVPIMVDPLSLTLRRCRDGVFALVSDSAGRKPLEGATLYPAAARARAESEGPARTDKEGVAFARIVAYGDRPIIAHHDGRYAIGGFGQVFEGIYEGFDDDHFRLREALKQAKRGEAKDSSASVYEDRHVVVAYTDRPTYRPGQDVHFKLIVRKLQPEAPPTKAERLALSFRADEFDARTRLVLPEVGNDISYDVFDPKGHAVAHGSVKLSEFGTAAGQLSLNSESVVGAYTFRVRIAGQPRIVPEVFAVKHYRRPNFEVNVAGVPELLRKPETLTIQVSSQYYFGPAVPNAAVEVRVVRMNLSKSVSEEHGRLDDKGQAKLEVRLPRALDSGKYLVLCSVTDDSGRTVTTTKQLTLELPGAPKGTNALAALPRFHPLDETLTIATTAKEVTAAQQITFLRSTVKDGVATFKFPGPGWYRLKAGDEEASIFVHGGEHHPLTFSRNDEDRRNIARWVNLSDFAFEDHGHLSRWERPSQHLYALFDRHSAKVGDKLRLLVYVPQKDARLLFTLEGRTILDYAVLQRNPTAGAYQVVEIPIKDRYFPNVYLQGRLLTTSSERLPRKQMAEAQKDLEKRFEEDFDEVDPRWCRIDVLKPVSASDGALRVQIETDRTAYRPGDTVRAAIKVTDRDGKPQAAELSFAAIDESVFAFGEDKLDGLPGFFSMPHETRRFLPKSWRVSIGDRWREGDVVSGLNKLMRDMAMAQNSVKSLTEARQGLELESRPQAHFTLAPLPRLGGEMPSSQLPLAKLREHFQETAVWLPQLRTDETGTAQASFTLPDSLTRYRLSSVALTKTTEVGVGRARISAGLPLAVQVFLPRFAIEKDRLLAVAVVHNSTKEERECDIAWRIEGASVDGPSPAPADWKLTNEKGAVVGTGRIRVPANGSTKVGLWLKLEQIGTAKVIFRATDGKESDAEARTLPVQALGRAAEINVNEQLAVVPVKKDAEKVIAGKFHKEGRVQLPDGFLARELHISLAASDIAQALDGLDYLVDYPHGCIEQTMSRFLPVIMIQHATQHAPVALQPEIARKLPDILAKGLTPVYGFQHDDGSWGWFSKDGRNLPMSVYVVYGLARCQVAGTKVDAAVLRRGCQYVQAELRTGKHESELVARSWYALALAGHADRNEFESHVRKTMERYPDPTTWCNLALACRELGCAELGERLWAKVRTMGGANQTDWWALRLNTQLAYGAPYADCQATARNILALRTGTHWYHTRDTSWAIEALANMLGYAPDKIGVRKVEVTLAGKTILEVKDAADLKKVVYRVRLTGDQLPLQEGLEIRMKADSDEPIHVAIRAAGVQRQDEIKANGTRVKMLRTYESLAGEPLEGPLKVGQVVRVRLRLDLDRQESYVMIDERRPALCEFADDAIVGVSARHAVHQEFRDDRLCVFFTSLPAGRHEIVYYLRAETLGRCSVLPGRAYPMYDEKALGETASNRLEVK